MICLFCKCTQFIFNNYNQWCDYCSVSETAQSLVGLWLQHCNSHGNQIKCFFYIQFKMFLLYPNQDVSFISKSRCFFYIQIKMFILYPNKEFLLYPNQDVSFVSKSRCFFYIQIKMFILYPNKEFLLYPNQDVYIISK